VVSRAKDDPPAAQAFEWIPHGDASARRRARAHISRGFRRQKAAQALKDSETVKEKENTNARSNVRRDSTLESTVVNVSTVQPCDETQGWVSQELALQPTLGSGRGDPFACIRITLGPEKQALLDHCTYNFPR
jgi:hypothetical protein